MKKDLKFTLLELVLSITCIIVIALIIIPFVSNIFKVTEKKVFIEFADSVYQKTLDLSNNLNKEEDVCYIYDITKDFNYDNLGTFEGYSIVKNDSIYLSIHNQVFMLDDYEYISKNDVDYVTKEYNSLEFGLDDFLLNINCQNSEYMSK
jgi:hypothetical protein